jgi:hypothetical protein
MCSCPSSTGGVVSFTFIQDSSVKTSLTQELVLYADQEQSWPSVYGSDMACIDKVRAAKKSYPIQWLDSAPEKAHSYQYEIIGIIPRWWYIAVANCANQRENTTDQGLAIAYWNIHFTNNGGLWTYEFSQDVQGIFQMSCFFLVLYWLMMFVLAWIKNHAKGKNLQYQVVKYVFVAMLIQWVGLLFNLAHYAKYAHDGIGVPELESSFFCPHTHRQSEDQICFN